MCSKSIMGVGWWMALGKLPVPGHPTFWMIVGQGFTDYGHYRGLYHPVLDYGHI